MKFRTKFEVVLQKQFPSVVVNHSKSDFSTVNWLALSENIRQMYSAEILSNTAVIREVNSIEVDSEIITQLKAWRWTWSTDS